MTTACVLLIPAHDEEARIAACLDSALRSPLPPGFVWRRWVVYDNASTDDTAGQAHAWARENGCPPLDVVRRTGNAGKCSALDEFHRDLIDGGRLDDVVVVLDADVVVEPEAMAALVGPMTDRSVSTVWGLGVPDRRTWGHRAAAFQLLVTAELARGMGPAAVRAAGGFFAYRVGPLVEMRWRPELLYDDVQLAEFLRRRGLTVRSAWTARFLVTPARGYRDFYIQTYRYLAARRINEVDDIGHRTRLPWGKAAAALARAGRADPFGAVAYGLARLVAAAIHTARPLRFTDSWQQARSTKGPLPASRNGSTARALRLHVRVVVGSMRAFSNWPMVLAGVIGNRIGLTRGDIRFVTRAGLEVTCPGGTMVRAAVLEVFATRIYHLDRLPVPGDSRPLNVLDVGAHIGAFALGAAERFPGAVVTCYEPSPDAVRYLRSNVGRNGLSSRIRVHDAAVGSTAGRAVLYESGPAFGSNSLVPMAGAATREVPVVAFEAAVANAGGHIDLLKLDCEGAEYDIILGSADDSWREVQAVILEYHPVAGRSPGQVLQRLQALGFELLWHEPGTEDGLGMAGLARDRVPVR